MGAKAVPRLAQVGVRELRQNLSVYLRRIKQGERLEVTEHGRLVALLVPPPATDSVLDRLVAAGLATRATRDIRDLPPPLPLRSGERPASEILQEMRDEDDR
ncbi:MAG TPA: type II toxin-antitoxin system prevent-host-death family antitoxin [Terriglobales bacterium]